MLPQWSRSPSRFPMPGGYADDDAVTKSRFAFAGFTVDGRALQQVRRASELLARRVSGDVVLSNIKKIGGSVATVLPKTMLDRFHLEAGD